MPESELEKKSKDLAAWLSAAGTIFVPTDETLLFEVQDILEKHSGLVREHKRAFAADPFVIGLAKLRGAAVVSEERGGTISKPSIPLVCGIRSVRCLLLLEF
ncbi:DUF4411 family protein, partial [Streptomyces albidoflavus]|uniref:DUF4411 family protein n=1 Tax=Streptomyces albidoflavus TaxID=1886 RepID=UPI003419814D